MRGSLSVRRPPVQNYSSDRRGAIQIQDDWLRALERVATTPEERPNPVSAFWRAFLRGLEVTRL